MKENNTQNVETKVLDDDLISMGTHKEDTLVSDNHGENEGDNIDDLLADEPIVGKPEKSSSVGKKLAAAAGIGVVGAAAAGVGAYAVANDGLNINAADDDNVTSDAAHNNDDRIDLQEFLFGDRNQAEDIDVDSNGEPKLEDIIDPTDEVKVELVEGNYTEPVDDNLVNMDDDVLLDESKVSDFFNKIFNNGEDNIVEEPIVEPVEEPIVEPVEKSIEESNAESIEELIEEPIVEPIEEPEPSVVGQAVDVNVVVTPTDNSDSLVSLASVNTDGMSFNEAFAAARAEVGANGVFKWNGGVYGTFYENEWAEMSDEFKSEFSNHNWAAEYQDGNMEVALGDQDIIMANDGVFDFNEDGLINDVDVELIADNTQDFSMSFIADGDVSMTEIMDEVNEYLPGEILAGDFNVEVEVVGMEPIYEAYDAPIESDFVAMDVEDNLLENDLLDDVMIDNDDFIC